MKKLFFACCHGLMASSGISLDMLYDLNKIISLNPKQFNKNIKQRYFQRNNSSKQYFHNITKQTSYYFRGPQLKTDSKRLHQQRINKKSLVNRCS